MLKHWDDLPPKVLNVRYVDELLKVFLEFSKLSKRGAVLDLGLDIAAHGCYLLDGVLARVLKYLAALLHIDLQPDQVILLGFERSLDLDLLLLGFCREIGVFFLQRLQVRQVFLYFFDGLVVLLDQVVDVLPLGFVTDSVLQLDELPQGRVFRFHFLNQRGKIGV